MKLTRKEIVDIILDATEGHGVALTVPQFSPLVWFESRGNTFWMDETGRCDSVSPSSPEGPFYQETSSRILGLIEAKLAEKRQAQPVNLTKAQMLRCVLDAFGERLVSVSFNATNDYACFFVEDDWLLRPNGAVGTGLKGGGRGMREIIAALQPHIDACHEANLAKGE